MATGTMQSKQLVYYEFYYQRLQEGTSVGFNPSIPLPGSTQNLTVNIFGPNSSSLLEKKVINYSPSIFISDLSSVTVVSGQNFYVNFDLYYGIVRSSYLIEIFVDLPGQPNYHFPYLCDFGNNNSQTISYSSNPTQIQFFENACLSLGSNCPFGPCTVGFPIGEWPLKIHVNGVELARTTLNVIASLDGSPDNSRINSVKSTILLNGSNLIFSFNLTDPILASILAPLTDFRSRFNAKCAYANAQPNHYFLC